MGSGGELCFLALLSPAYKGWKDAEETARCKQLLIVTTKNFNNTINDFDAK